MKTKLKITEIANLSKICHHNFLHFFTSMDHFESSVQNHRQFISHYSAKININKHFEIHLRFKLLIYMID